MTWIRRTGWAVVTAVCGTVLVGCPAGGGGWGGGEGEGSGYTILLTALSSPNHNADARYYRDAMERSGWSDLTVVHKDRHSELFWGTYKTMAAGQKDLRQARAYKDGRGGNPFRNARLLPVPGKDVGPPEWKLTRAKGFYTVVVCSYYDVPKDDYVGRRRFAVEQCKLFREKGHEAYYHHGPTKSYVTIGTFDKDALKAIGERDIHGDIKTDSHTIRTETTVKTVIVDEGIKKVLKAFPRLGENGNEVSTLVRPKPVPGQPQPWRKRVVARPYPVKIPRTSGADLPGSTHQGAGVWTRM